MGRKKSQDEEIELLLSALQEDVDNLEEIETLDLTNDVTDFLNFFNIRPGSNKIRSLSFYEHYKNWSQSPASYVTFSKIISKTLTIEKTYNKNTVFIKNDLIELNNEVVRNARARKHLKRSHSYKKHIEKFIEDMEIVPGDKWVDINVIYKWYISWRYKKKTIRLLRRDLRGLLKFYFESRIGKSRGFFKVKGEFNMEKINQLRGITNEEEKQKSEDQILGAKTGIQSEDEI
jgi:hypothetical protein